MDIRHLKLVEAVAETGNLTRAAEQLFLSQSALSHQLKELEEELQTQVFMRTSKQMLLTPAGKRLLQTAKQILHELQKAQVDIQCMTQADSGIIRLTTGCYTCYHWLSPVMIQFRKNFPKVTIDIMPEATREPIEYLLNGRLDLVLTSDYSNNPNLEFRPVFEDELVALVPPGHPWENASYATAEDFLEETLIMYNIPDQDSTVLMEFFKPAGLLPKRIIKLQLTEAVVEMAKANLGIAVLAEWAVRPYLNRGELIAVPLREPVRRTWYIVSLKHREEPPYLQSFIDVVKEEVPVQIQI